MKKVELSEEQLTALKTARIENKISQEKIAFFLRIEQTNYSKFERGVQTLYDYQLQSIEEFLSIDIL